jgi:hypothetical protein
VRTAQNEQGVIVVLVVFNLVVEKKYKEDNKNPYHGSNSYLTKLFQTMPSENSAVVPTDIIEHNPHGRDDQQSKKKIRVKFQSDFLPESFRFQYLLSVNK